MPLNGPTFFHPKNVGEKKKNPPTREVPKWDREHEILDFSFFFLFFFLFFLRGLSCGF